MKRHLWIAVLSGVAIAAALMALNFNIDPDRHGVISRLGLIAQFPGWFLCVLLRGIHSATTTDYVVIAIPINSAFYASIILVALRLRRGRPPLWVSSVVTCLVVAGLGWATFTAYASAPYHGGPRQLPARHLARYADNENFGYWGLAFFDGRLYASTNLGLLELEGGVPRHLYRFQKRDSVISGPWIDRIHHRLWVLDEYTDELLNFDGTNWTRMPMPTPRKDSRGNALEGIHTAASDQSFWIVAGGDAWSWDEASRNWTAEELPPLEVADSVIGRSPDWEHAVSHFASRAEAFHVKSR